MLTEIKLSDIHPSPFRQLDRYPLDPAKIDRLRSGIHRTDFWGNVVVRRRDGRYELAVGHHRIEAVRRELGTDATVHVIVKDLDDATMLKMAAADNDEVYNPGMSFILETVEAAVRFLGKNLSPRRVGIKRIQLMESGEGELAKQVAKFLDWPLSRIRVALAELKMIHEGILSPEAIKVIRDEKGAETFHAGIRNALKAGIRIPHSEQEQLAKKVARAGNKSATAKALLADLTHPVQREERDTFRALLSEAGSRAHALGVALKEVEHHRDKLHSESYRHTVEAVNLAAQCSGLMELIPSVFQHKGLQEASEQVGK